MTSRSARLALALLLPLLAQGAHLRAASAADTPAADAIGDEQATAPPLPLLSPTQPYRPLNFYNRAELARFREGSVPFVPPWCSGAYLAPPLPRLAGDDQGLGSPVYVAADSMQLDETGESQVSGAVEVRQGQNLMRADSAVITANRDRLLLSGHVYLQDPAMTLEADSAELTLDGSGSHIVNTHYALHDAHIRGSARAIRRDSAWSVAIEGGAYTTCEPGHDTWYLKSENIRLDQEAGWGSATHVRLLVEQVPVMYVPYITFPIDKRRRTGVLYPTFTFSDGNGTDIAVPYYFNLDPQYDLLLTPRWIEDRGALLEGELRYLHGSPSDSVGTGSLGMGWIGKDAAYGDQDRYVLRFRHVGEPDPSLAILADATEVSDNDYLDDLSTRLSLNRDSHLVRVIQARRTLDNWTLLARAQGWQTINPTITDADQPYRRLPQLLAQGSLPVGGGVIAGLNTEYTFFDRDVDTLTANPTGSRLRVEPSLRLPLGGDWWQVEPAAKARYTRYDLEAATAGAPEHVVPTASLDGRLFLERDFRFHDEDWLQTLEPRAFLLWTPFRDQYDAPVFDTSALTFGYDQLFRDNRYTGGDRVGDAQQVSLAVESRLFSPDGREAARFGIGQALYADDLRQQLDVLDPVDTTRRSPLVASAAWRVSPRWSARAEGQWSPGDGEFVRGSARAGWQDEYYRTFNAAYRYDDPDIDQAELSGLLPVNANWNLVGRWVFDFNSARSLEALGGVEYESCCWRARVVARRTVDIDTGSATLVPDQGVVFEVELKGLGSLGDQISSELADNIPGYEKRRNALEQ